MSVEIAAVVSSPIFHWIGGGIIGFSVGAWLDTLVRRKENAKQKSAEQKSKNGKPS